jgi:hypothetical protein
MLSAIAPLAPLAPLALLAALAGPPSASVGGIDCRLSAVEIRTSLAFDEGRPDPVLSSYLSVTVRAEPDPNGPLCSESWVSIEEALDQDGRPRVKPPKMPPADRTLTRDAVRGRLLSTIHGNRSPLTMQARAALVGPGPAPRALSRLVVRTELITAEKVLWIPIDPATINEQVTLAPGVTLLLTRHEKKDRTVRLDYEVRIARPADPAPHEFEPVFAGLYARDPSGRILQSIPAHQEFATRDEYIIVTKDAVFSADVLDVAAPLSAVVVTGVKRVAADLIATDLSLSGK